MKKILAVFMLALVLCTSLSTVAFAVDAAPYAPAEEPDNFCTVNGNFENIEFSGMTYIHLDIIDGPFDISDAYWSGDDYIDVKAIFSDSEVKDLYNDIDIYYYSEYSYIICAGIEKKSYGYDTKYFVEESHYDDIVSFVKGESISGYFTESYHSYSVEDLSLATEHIDDWLETDQIKTQAAFTFSSCDSYPLFAADTGGAFRKEIGMILREYNYDGGADTYYLIYYPEYSRNYFYADGSFALDSDEITTFYVLTDATLVAELSAYYDTMPEDELDWMVDTTMPEEIFYVLLSFIFVVLPIAAIIFAIVVMMKKRGYNPYRPALIILMVSSSAVIIGYLVVLLQII